MADVADDPIYVDVPGRHPTGVVEARVGQFEHIAVLAQEHVVARYTHYFSQPGVGDHVAILAVYRHIELWFEQRNVGLDLVGLGVPCGVYVGDSGVNDFGTFSK